MYGKETLLLIDSSKNKTCYVESLYTQAPLPLTGILEQVCHTYALPTHIHYMFSQVAKITRREIGCVQLTKEDL